jgi:hypothetical protein
MTIFVGGVSELFQSDLDLGRLAIERLQEETWAADVAVEELHYGAVAVAQRLEEVRPEVLVLISAVRRDRPAGMVERRRIDPPHISPEDLQAAVGDAVTGYVHVDLIIDVAAGFGVLPRRTVSVEVEPEITSSGEGLSDSARLGLDVALDLARAEVRRSALIALAGDLRPLTEVDRLERSASRDTMRQILVELVLLDREGRWGRTFSLRDRLRLSLTHDVSSEEMDHRDWALWWTLIEELDRLEALEAS